MARLAKQEVEISLLTANAMLGYKYKSDHFWLGIHEYRPDAIVIDSGSTHGGPFKLDMGRKTVADESYIRGLTPYITACAHYGMKLLISSAGGDGSGKHVADILAIVNKIIEDNGFKFKSATIGAAVPRELIRQKLKDGINSAVHVAAQMGPEPFIKTPKEETPDIIVAGRAYNPSPFAAFCMNLGFERAPAFHLGKILECGGQCAVPKGRSMIATIRKDDFLENRVRNYTRGLFPELDKFDDCCVIFHVYGRNAIMGPLKQNSEPAHEVGALGEVVAQAPPAAKAMAICNSARVSCLHFYYPGILATTGNLASPLSPHEQDAGAVFKFSLYHLMGIKDTTGPILFPIKSSTVGAGTFVKDENFGKQFFNLDNFLNISRNRSRPSQSRPVLLQ
ncbi:hypothetical protein GCG54_00003914 [Colletotrichum gloeosporioides]|uniref:Uncharacterized protein n=1 Tax=Colletotrichum gloeosporioides TaxID=474922 RepID=A0A8H4C6D0_COLGL|nr:uncharacterized protein GCG54_00003914 [Colletotrichum gloeosporioides]KAF3798012.1 hypothetical protein GCG54_00003914 [Colletotrichum gloeosporioides]